MIFNQYRKGMSLKEFQEMVAAGDKHTSYKQRSPEEIEAAGRYPSGRVKPKPRKKHRPGVTVVKPGKPVSPKADTMRPVWFVDARRNGTEVHLAAPRGEDEARNMAAHLTANDWTAQAVCRSTYRTDPRFFALAKEA